MPKRATFVLDDHVGKRLREIQAKMIQTETISVSFSKVISEALRNRF